MTNPAYRLEAAGFTREQVDALMEHTAASVATKEDIAELKGAFKEDIAGLKGAFKEDIAELKGDMNTRFENLEGKMNARFEKLSGKFNIVYWMFGFIFLAVVGPYLKTIFG